MAAFSVTASLKAIFICRRGKRHQKVSHDLRKEQVLSCIDVLLLCLFTSCDANVTLIVAKVDRVAES